MNAPAPQPLKLAEVMSLPPLTGPGLRKSHSWRLKDPGFRGHRAENVKIAWGVRDPPDGKGTPDRGGLTDRDFAVADPPSEQRVGRLSGIPGGPVRRVSPSLEVVPVMSMVDRWSVELSIGKDDDETHAEARLVLTDRDQLYGHGKARHNPADPDVTEIGEEIAVARALSELAHNLLNTAAAELEEVTHQRVRLDM